MQAVSGIFIGFRGALARDTNNPGAVNSALGLSTTCPITDQHTSVTIKRSSAGAAVLPTGVVDQRSDFGC
eukprot:6579389-Pyramimonas_sp.AAC.1